MAKHSCRTTSPKIGTKASSIMRDNRYSAKAKSVAASALSQCSKKGK